MFMAEEPNLFLCGCSCSLTHEERSTRKKPEMIPGDITGLPH